MCLYTLGENQKLTEICFILYNLHHHRLQFLSWSRLVQHFAGRSHEWSVKEILFRGLSWHMVRKQFEQKSKLRAANGGYEAFCWKKHMQSIDIDRTKQCKRKSTWIRYKRRFPMLLHFNDIAKSSNLTLPARLFPEISAEAEVRMTCVNKNQNCTHDQWNFSLNLFWFLKIAKKEMLNE